MSMHCLPVWAPWGSLMFLEGGLAKDVENRGEALPESYKLPLEVLVFQGAKWDPACSYLQLRKMVGPLEAGVLANIIAPRRAILGTVKITGCRQDSRSRWAAKGAWHWELADPKPFAQPVTYLAGRQARPFFWAPSPNKDELFRPHDGTTRRVDVRVECPDVMITRPGRWGNPYKVYKVARRWWAVWDLDQNVAVAGAPSKQGAVKLAVKRFKGYAADKFGDRLHELKGKRLGCYCREHEPCHGDILAELVREVCGD
ncbi:MAG: DUF4326 domain-containing protein [Desulfarculaceae bacterium]|nr:DUF4326 domain-containing protein [Desulfarculaceae bacterium]MCF8073275.1 DUF4326 domain-containing protein [Desulfarculaceae bacterium]MCF8100871.1 DUF4326 domain-containing protein [Desulfarculaceae bacterium]MCF8116673.1 DUF4326 domain-containing protein [Desulfarculaceae bacterium]